MAVIKVVRIFLHQYPTIPISKKKKKKKKNPTMHGCLSILFITS